MTYIYFTEEQKEQAKNADLVSFLQNHGERLKRSGSEFEWRNGTDKVTVRGNKWFHQYDREGGDAIAFIRRFYNKDYPEAVEILLGGSYGTLSDPEQYVPHKPKKPFVLPPPNSDMRRVYAYLLKRRFIDRDVIHYFTHNKMLYEDAEFHNAVFVGFDENGIPRHAHKRGTYGESSYKGNIDSSDAVYSFHSIGTSNRLYVFEAPIDMLSYITLHQRDWQEHSYVSLCCVAEQAAIKMLELHPNIDTVYLCLDHDKAGIESCYRIAERICELGNYKVYRKEPFQKDWNEQLKAENGIEPLPGTPHPGMEQIRELCSSLSEEKIEWLDEYDKLRRYPQKLTENTFETLTDMLDKLKRINPNNISAVQEHTLEMTRCALAFSLLKHCQLGIKHDGQWYANFMFAKYKPHRDNVGFKRRIADMKYALEAIIHDYSEDKIHTKSEAEEQISHVLEFGLDALRLNAFVTLGGQKQTESMQMTM